MFIEVTSTNNTKVLVNLNAVEDIIKSTIYFTTKGDFVNCKETYEELKEKIKNTGAIQ